MKFNSQDKILVIGQYLTSRTEAVRVYLIPRAKHLFVIALGSALADDKQNYLFCYAGGRLKKQIVFRHPLLKKIRQHELMVILTFCFYVYDIIRIVIRSRRKYALCIGISHFSGFISVLLKRLLICKKNIYYALDYYSPLKEHRGFKLFLLNISNYADKIVVYYADEVWDISPRISQGRLEFSGIKKESYSQRQKIVPLGYSRGFFRNEDIARIERYSVVFVGVIVKGQGLELLLEALPEIKKVIPRIRIRVIGSGPFLPEFKRMAEASSCGELFEFYGFIAEEKKMLDIIASSAVGLSIWDRRTCNLNFYYGDPGKTKLYAVCGLPVIVSRETVFSQVVAGNKAGVGIGYDKDELMGALRTVLLDTDVYAVYKSNAVRVAKEYCDAEKIFSEALKCQA